MRRVEEIVMPEVEAWKPLVAKQVLDEMRSAGVRGTKDELRQAHSKRCINIVRLRLSLTTPV